MGPESGAEGRIEAAVGQIKDQLNGLFVKHLPEEVRAVVTPVKGKFNRARLLLGFAVLGGRIAAPALALAAGVELLHLASLVQDDLVDYCEYRHGRKTLSGVRGAAAATFFSDWLFGEAYRFFCQSGLAWVEPINRIVQRMALSELRQELLIQRGGLRPVLGGLRYNYGKTAIFFEICCKFGFQSAQTDSRRAAWSGKTGLWWGMAYQLGNDLEDLLIVKQTGDTGDHDRQRGLLTVPVLLLLQKQPKLGLTVRTLPRAGLLRLMRLHGVLEETERLRQNCLAKARQFLNRLGAEPPERELIASWLAKTGAAIFPAALNVIDYTNNSIR
jgi:heptaprenyl diphosphate synthase